MENPIATITMENGKEIIIELCPSEAPNTVNSFIYLANKGCFDNYSISRIVPGYVIDVSYTAFDNEECKYLINNESKSNGFVNNIKIEPGVIAMGGYDDGIAGGEFYFPLAYHEKLDGNYPGFGRVLKGWEEIQRWENVEIIPVPYPECPTVEINKPAIPIVIKEVRVDTKGVSYSEPIRKKIKYMPPSW